MANTTNIKPRIGSFQFILGPLAGTRMKAGGGLGNQSVPVPAVVPAWHSPFPDPPRPRLDRLWIALSAAAVGVMAAACWLIGGV